MPRAMTKTEHDKILLLLEHGLTREEIRTMTGWSNDTITKVKHGMYSPDITDKPTRGRMTPATLEKMRKLFSEGKSDIEIARETYLSDQVVKKARTGGYDHMQQPELIREACIPAIMLAEMKDMIVRIQQILDAAEIVTREGIE